MFSHEKGLKRGRIMRWTETEKYNTSQSKKKLTYNNKILA